VPERHGPDIELPAHRPHQRQVHGPVYPRTCDAAFRDTSGQVRRYPRLRRTGFVLAGMASSMNHVSAAQAATRHVPLKRQGGVSSLTRAEPRVYPRTCDAALRDTIGQARGYTRLTRTGSNLAGIPAPPHPLSPPLPA